MQITFKRPLRCECCGKKIKPIVNSGIMLLPNLCDDCEEMQKEMEEDEDARLEAMHDSCLSEQECAHYAELDERAEQGGYGMLQK